MDEIEKKVLAFKTEHDAVTPEEEQRYRDWLINGGVHVFRCTFDQNQDYGLLLKSPQKAMQRVGC